MRGSWVATAALLAFGPSQLAQAKVHTITVGNGGFKYRPNTTFADVGDIIQFEFFPPNHSVIRSMYTESPECPGGYCNPCVPWTLYNADANSSQFFDSGLRAVAQDQIRNPPSWNLTINDTSPIFFYCDAVDSCHPNGMVGVINPNSSTSLQKQFAAAVDADYQLNPGDSFPAEGETPTATATPIPASATATSTPASATPSSGGDTNHHGGGLSGGAIAGIVVGAVAAVALGGLALYFCGKSRAYSELFKHSRKEADRYEAAEAEKAATMSESGQTGSAVGGWVSKQDGEHYTNPNTVSVHSAWTHPSSGQLSPPLPGYGQSPKPEGGQFIGYNRESGAPEFAVEAPYHHDQGQISELGVTEAPKKPQDAQPVPEVHGESRAEKRE